MERMTVLKLLSHISNALIDKGTHVSNLFIATRIQKLLLKNKIKVMHFNPGRIRVKSSLWVNKPNMKRLVEELEQDPKIYSVTYTEEVGSLLILFDKSILNDYSQIEKWLKKAESINL
jgi:hypothetical protein